MTEPLAALDPGGKAAVLSYDVPEPISYSGWNYIEIPLAAEAFTTVVTTPSELPAPQLARRVDDAPALAPAVQVPGHVVLSDDDDAPLVRSSEQPVSDRLRAMTVADARAAAVAGRTVRTFTNIAGQLDARIKNDDSGVPAPDNPPPEEPEVIVLVRSPSTNATLRGTSQGVTFDVAGRTSGVSAGGMTLTIGVDQQPPSVTLPNPGAAWRAPVTITGNGFHDLRVELTGTGWSVRRGAQITVHDVVTVRVAVWLDPADGGPAAVLPTVTVTKPQQDTSFTEPSGVVTATVEGRSTAGAGATVASVTVTDSSTGTTTSVAPDASGAWSTQLLLEGVGRHDLRVVARDNQDRVSSPVPLVCRVLASPPFRRLKNRLMLVETLNLSSFLGSFGAGRVIKTFSLLPGEETTISMKSWTKSAETRKTASSVVDSDATEASDSFEDALSTEQTNREAESEASAYKVGASLSATWGWGSASINAEASGSANSAREEAVKNVGTATRKHCMKASTNRNISVNTEYTASQEVGSEESTTRRIANINASRTLNFVFRQMNQEHVTLIHLTNVRIAFYTEDLMIGPDGTPVLITDPVTHAQVLDIRRDYREVPLSQLQVLLDAAISREWQEKIEQAVILALSGIPDYQDVLRKVFEWVTPTDDQGQPVEAARYMRFPRNLTTSFQDPSSGQSFTVPGIVLAYDHIVMRTEGILVDSVLGQGEALDAYSKGLQGVAIDERRMALAERQAQIAREDLARELVTSGDEQRATVFATVFPPPTVPPPAREPVPPGN